MVRISSYSQSPQNLPQFPSVKGQTDALITGVKPEKGKMRLRIFTDSGSVTIAYKECDPKKKLSFLESRLYKKVEVTAGGQKREVLLNKSSMKKHLGISKSETKVADQKTMKLFVSHQFFISQATLHGLSRSEALSLAKTIDAKFPEWQQGAQDTKLKKGEGDQTRTIKYYHDSGEVHVRRGKLGKGAMGKVTKSIIFQTGQVVAHKKVIPPSAKPVAFPDRGQGAAKAQKSPEENEMLQKKLAKEREFLKQEGELVKTRLSDCPHVVQAHKVGNGVMFEFMNGGSLEQSKTEKMGKVPALKKVPVKQRIAVIQQIVAGVVEVHGKKLAHRDIKGGNILLHKDEKGNYIAKLADFGLAKDLGSPDSGVSGTPGHFSPDRLEAALGFNPDKKCEAKDDLFALGIALYEMHHGKPHPIYDKLLDLEVLSDDLMELRKKPANETAIDESKRLQQIATMENQAKTQLADLRKAIQNLPEPQKKRSIDHFVWQLLRGKLTDDGAKAASKHLRLSKADE